MPAETVTLVTGAGSEPGRWPYAAAKAAAVNLVRSAAIDFVSAGIRVNAVCPGPIRTGMTQRIENADPARYEALRRVVPLQRWGSADEVANVLAFLLSPQSILRHRRRAARRRRSNRRERTGVATTVGSGR